MHPKISELVIIEALDDPPSLGLGIQDCVCGCSTHGKKHALHVISFAGNSWCVCVRSRDSHHGKSDHQLLVAVLGAPSSKHHTLAVQTTSPNVSSWDWTQGAQTSTECRWQRKICSTWLYIWQGNGSPLDPCILFSMFIQFIMSYLVNLKFKINKFQNIF